MSGKLIVVVGPSGAGKDSVVRYAMTKFKNNPQFIFPRRVITRNADVASEDHDTMDVSTFLASQSLGAFALSWQAHGHHYGIPMQIHNELAAGKHVVINVSRTIIPDLPKLYPCYFLIEITAPSEILEARLAGRGRSSDGNLAKRNAREITPLIRDSRHFTISNETTLDEAGEAFCAVIDANTRR